MNKRGCFDVPTYVLEAMLQLPLEWKISGGHWDAGRECFAVFVEGEGLPACPEGVHPVGIRPITTVGQGRDLVAARIKWPIIPASQEGETE